uniref:ATP-grasp domain-containing protein n=1 Tax=Candidatus Kentrum sp. LPFa TaxID=2126335 RepID=A0A450WN73_9GAMM|nr:MAG: ATP-grasp domain-containing protein [Candidatus Kentron sp. LPFa]
MHDSTLVKRSKNQTHLQSRARNKQNFQEIVGQAESFFTRLGALLNLRAFPIHAEFRITEAGELLPIELNPLRYGGTGLTDLTYWSFGQCPQPGKSGTEKVG